MLTIPINTVSAGSPAQKSSQPSVEIEKVRYCLYARKSSEDDERQALSIESQINEMRRLAEREGIEIAEIRRESHSAKASGKRPEFNKLVSDIRMGLFSGIITWAPDRLSRNAGDLGSLVDLMDQGRLHDIRTYGQRFRNSPNEKFLLMILCSQAKLENDNRRLNVKRGQKTKAEMGIRPCMAPLGYLHQKGFGRNNKAIIDPIRAPIIREVFERVANRGWSGRQLMKWMAGEGNFTTRSGKRANLSIIYRMLSNEFYYGYYEYPSGSGNWYLGNHEPIITKELFEKAREQLKTAPKNWGVNDFEYTKLFTCGVCGANVTGEEKFKTLADGTKKRYVYYRCNNARLNKCKEKYIKEEVIAEQMLEIISKADLSGLPIREKIAEEIRRYKRFAVDVLNQQSVDVKVSDLDIRKHTQHLFLSGKPEERREVLEGLKGKIMVKASKVCLEL
ncbi:MAG: recombinase family protein [Candidatus Gracilibacteria bacterium]|nr:recombinase family protein [Candidatus Gracilibacteria bacterium]